MLRLAYEKSIAGFRFLQRIWQVELILPYFFEVYLKRGGVPSFDCLTARIAWVKFLQFHLLAMRVVMHSKRVELEVPLFCCFFLRSSEDELIGQVVLQN